MNELLYRNPVPLYHMAGRGFDALQKHFAPLQIQADERDARFLAGGNFFGREGER